MLMPHFSPFTKLRAPKLRFAFIGIISLLGPSALLALDDASTPSPTPPGKHSKHQPAKPKPKTPPSDNSSSSSNDDPQEGPGFDGVAYIDKKLSSLITVEKVNNELSPMKLLTVYVDIRNKTRKPLELQVQTMYEDTSRNLVSSDNSWIEFPLKPHELQEYCSVALSQNARSYLVRIRLEPADGSTNTAPGNGEGIPVATPTPVSTADASTPTPTPLASETPTPQPTPKPVPHHKPRLVDPSTLP